MEPPGGQDMDPPGVQDMAPTGWQEMDTSGGQDMVYLYCSMGGRVLIFKSNILSIFFNLKIPYLF